MNQKSKYNTANQNNWKGRESNSLHENQYWYQEIILFDHIENLKTNTIDVGLIGYNCDEGVRRNLGRVGTKDAPQEIRKQLAKLPIHFKNQMVADMGDIICLDGDLELCQVLFSKYIRKLIIHNVMPIGIGGGHDIAFASFLGIWETVKSVSNNIGIINFDAHFDLRILDNCKGNSGTPFYQIFDLVQSSNQNNVEYFVVGIQSQSNTKELFEIAKNRKVSYVSNFECNYSDVNVKNVKKQLNDFIKNKDYLYLSIDMDAFSSSYAPGVSAPSPLGFSPSFFFEILKFLMNTEKIISIDIAETNPKYDIDNHTTNLAAKIIDYIVIAKSKMKS